MQTRKECAVTKEFAYTVFLLLMRATFSVKYLKPLNTELIPICHLLALLGAHHILHVNRIRVNRKFKVSTKSMYKIQVARVKLSNLNPSLSRNAPLCITIVMIVMNIIRRWQNYSPGKLIYSWKCSIDLCPGNNYGLHINSDVGISVCAVGYVT
jgi:hypothetical protein